MKPVLLVAVVLLASLAGACAASGPDAPAAAPTGEHAWLLQLVGDWDVTAETSMGPEAEPAVMRSTESVRALGGLWVLAEGRADLGGRAFTSVMTLGYDPAQQAFVGTWVDTMFPYLWRYTGRLDEARRVLTLETSGPSFDDPTKTANYRDVIEIVDADHRILTSSAQQDDGTWSTHMRGEYTRKP